VAEYRRLILLLWLLAGCGWGQTDLSDMPPFFEGELLDPEAEETPDEYLLWLFESALMQLRAELPRRLDDTTWLENMTLEEERLVYAYRLESLLPEERDMRVLEQRLWPRVLMAVCVDEIAHLAFHLKRNVTFRYAVPHSSEILEIEVHPTQCSGVGELRS